jgi:ribosomal protein S3
MIVGRGGEAITVLQKELKTLFSNNFTISCVRFCSSVINVSTQSM